MTRPGAAEPTPHTRQAHYFDPEPVVAARPRELTWSVAGVTTVSTTDAGVFSGGRLDPGTAVLLDRAPPPGGDVLLDLGCGWGPVAIFLARCRPSAAVWAVDVNTRARELTRRNVDRAGVGTGVRVADPGEVPRDLAFDEIWSNPPIRVGKQALHELLERWLPRLRPGGSANLVVSRDLGADSLAGWLAGQGHPVRRTASVRGYRLLRVGPPASGRRDVGQALDTGAADVQPPLGHGPAQ